MDDLIIRVLGGAASSFEEERLKRWRETAEENEEHFQEMAQVWALTAPEPVAPAWGPPAVEAILEADDGSEQDLGVLPISQARALSSRRAEGRWSSWKAAGLLAASVAALALGVRFIVFAGPGPMATYRAADGRNQTVTLSDGSYVRLAQGSVLEEWAVEGRREVSLDGKGFFAVARDESRPFVVRAGSGEVRVLGTRFQVEEKEEGVTTLVVEGLVRVANAQGSVEVSKGEMANMADGRAPSAQEVEDVYALLDWPDGFLVFQATPLSLVVQEVSRHYGRPMQVSGPELSNRRVTAWFQGEPFEAVAESLCLVTEALCSSVDSGVTMRLENESGGV